MQHMQKLMRRSWSSLRSRRLLPELAAALLLSWTAAVPLLGFAPAANAQSPDRIVVAGGVVTEVLYALGLQDRIVGVDTTSQFPPEALRDKPNVGYVRALSAEGVLSLKPSLVIATEGAGPPDAISLLNEAGVRIARIPEDYSPEGVATKIAAIGAVAGRPAPAQQLADQVKERFAALEPLRAALPAKRRVLFVLSLQNGRPLVGGRDTSADAIIRLAGGINAADAIQGFKPMTDEAVIEAAPDIVLMMDRGDHSAAKADPFALPSFSATPAAAHKALVVMDGLYMLGFGPRTPDAARDLMAALYPEAGIAKAHQPK